MYEHSFRDDIRLLPPVPRWSATLLVSRSKEEFRHALADASTEANLPIFGYCMPHAKGSFLYRFGRYPRLSLGPLPADAALETLAELLARTSGAQLQCKEATPTLPIRVLLGLREGYETEEELHSRSEIRVLTSAKVDVTPATVFSQTQDGQYMEPAVLLHAPRESVPHICTLALDLRQERFVIEDLHAETSQMVETSYCTDPEPIIS